MTEAGLPTPRDIVIRERIEKSSLPAEVKVNVTGVVSIIGLVEGIKDIEGLRNLQPRLDPIGIKLTGEDLKDIEDIIRGIEDIGQTQGSNRLSIIRKFYPAIAAVLVERLIPDQETQSIREIRRILEEEAFPDIDEDRERQVQEMIRRMHESTNLPMGMSANRQIAEELVEIEQTVRAINTITDLQQLIEADGKIHFLYEVRIKDIITRCAKILDSDKEEEAAVIAGFYPQIAVTLARSVFLNRAGSQNLVEFCRSMFERPVQAGLTASREDKKDPSQYRLGILNRIDKIESQLKEEERWLNDQERETVVSIVTRVQLTVYIDDLINIAKEIDGFTGRSNTTDSLRAELEKSRPRLGLSKKEFFDSSRSKIASALGKLAYPDNPTFAETFAQRYCAPIALSISEYFFSPTPSYPTLN